MDNTLPEKNYQPYLESLDKFGFCTIPVFDDAGIEQLRLLYLNNFGDQLVKNLYVTHNSNPVEKSLNVSREIQKIISARLLNIFPNYNYFTGHFMVKAANANQEFALHQDWNIVDEAKYKSYQIWIPLQSTYPANGGMFVVSGSHRFFNNYRSGSFDIPRIPFDEKFKGIVTNLEVPVGHVLIYQNALFHGSYGNTTGNDRIVAMANFVEKQAPTYYFHRSPKIGVAELYGLDGETLIKHLPQLEKGNGLENFSLVGTLPVGDLENAKISPTDVVEHYLESIRKGN